MALNFDTLQKLEMKIRAAETVIRDLREENRRLTAAIDPIDAGRNAGVHDGLIPVTDVRVLVEQRDRMRHGINRMLSLLDRIQH